MKNKNIPTAGFRGAHWDPARMAGRATGEAIALLTDDGAVTTGVLYGDGDAVVMAQHPREFVLNHYLTPYLLDAGISVFVQAPRSIGNDLRLEHEQALYEVAAGVTEMRRRGFKSVYLLGNSGGASLYAYYLQQANAAPENRLERSPTGRPTKFAAANMPPADGLILLSPHPGQGVLLLNGLDPSVTDEDDPFAVDPALSAFAPENGFVFPPQTATYASDFQKRYKAGQVARAQKLDTWARESIAARQAGRARLKEAPSQKALTQSVYSPIKTLWRTDADLRSFDLTIDPSERSYGSLWGPNPIRSNYGTLGFGRLITPESWLSTWSGLSSRAKLADTLPDIDQPTFMVTYRGDNSVFPSDARDIFAAIKASEKTCVDFSGNHHGWVNGERTGQDEAGAAIAQWIKERERT